MDQDNNFITLGRRHAGKAIRDQAEHEIAAIKSSDLSNEDKQKEITRIERRRDEQIKRLKSSSILWSKK